MICADDDDWHGAFSNKIFLNQKKEDIFGWVHCTLHTTKQQAETALVATGVESRSANLKKKLKKGENQIANDFLYVNRTHTSHLN